MGVDTRRACLPCPTAGEGNEGIFNKKYVYETEQAQRSRHA